jgi:hypothetical protein
LLLLAAYLAAWVVAGQRVSRAEAEQAVRTYLAYAMTRAQVAEAGSNVPDSATAERWLADRAALGSAVVASLDVRRSWLDVPFATRSRFFVRVRFASGATPPVQHFLLRKRRLSKPEVVWPVAEWRYRYRI